MNFEYQDDILDQPFSQNVDSPSILENQGEKEKPVSQQRDQGKVHAFEVNKS